MKCLHTVCLVNFFTAPKKIISVICNYLGCKRFLQSFKFLCCPSHLRQIQLGHGLILHCFNEFNLKSYEFPVCVPCSYQHCLSSRERSLVEHFTGILEVRVWVPFRLEFFVVGYKFFSAKTMYQKQQQQQNIKGAKEIKTNCLLDHRLWKHLSR